MKPDTRTFYEQAVHAAVTEIAFDAGYETHEAFTRAFRAYFATSPSAFAERKHRRIELTAPCGVHFRSTASFPHSSREIQEVRP